MCQTTSIQEKVIGIICFTDSFTNSLKRITRDLEWRNDAQHHRWVARRWTRKKWSLEWICEKAHWNCAGCWLNRLSLPPRHGECTIDDKKTISCSNINGTAGYADVRKFLERQKQLVTVGLGIPVSIVVENQRRMVWLKRMESGSHDSIIPRPGDFHAAVHMLMALHILWWAPLERWLVENTGFCEATIVEFGVAWSFFNVTVF